MNEAKVKLGQELPVTIKRIGINGEGIGYFKKTIVFVKGALTGEEVVVEVIKVASNYIVAKLKKIKRKAVDRMVPPCPVYEACGGCQLQHLTYEAQLVFKKDLVKQALERYTSFDLSKMKIRDTIGMDEPFRYRNKSQFQVRKDHFNQINTGLFGAESHDLVPIEDCLVQDERTMKLNNTVRDLLKKFKVSIYNERKGTGIVRTIVTRVGVKTNEMQLVLVTNGRDFPNISELIKEVCSFHPELVSIVQNINTSKTSLIFGEETRLLYGKSHLTEKLNQLVFDLSARAFFQLNPVQTEKLYQEVRHAFSFSGNEKLVDAYCGVGTIGLALSNEVAEVRGMDVIPEAISDAKENARKNGVDHVHYEVGQAEELFPKWIKEGYEPDAVVVDPPRTGLDDELLRTLLRVRPKQLVYVSCNPATLAKDLAVLAKRFRIRYIQPVDMFPMTSHVECVVRMQRRNY
ncbi:23S rRNA (uracil(1939)-C(5))-methyltransferase RlmD [Listeria sp. PSOL-1]|uniref:23S rRNA (uracil(1939)-C(5))-methyltransferase RlmD n=1 Tax=Listeria sp. PSOL-1 TaxID=1844999 RepID=UPI0013D3554E|nr:23S rRNA (uracil(1939)-C(5))-methyltransferase RlmD [Listeria sp. PSOL-1]